MAISKDAFSLNVHDNLELKKMFSGKRVGDKITLESTFQIGEVSEQLVTGSIISVRPMGLDEDANPLDPDAPVSAASAVMTGPRASPGMSGPMPPRTAMMA